MEGMREVRVHPVRRGHTSKTRPICCSPCLEDLMDLKEVGSEAIGAPSKSRLPGSNEYESVYFVTKYSLIMHIIRKRLS